MFIAGHFVVEMYHKMGALLQNNCTRCEENNSSLKLDELARHLKFQPERSAFALRRQYLEGYPVQLQNTVDK